MNKKSIYFTFSLFFILFGGIFWFFQSKTSGISTPSERGSILDLFFPRQAGQTTPTSEGARGESGLPVTGEIPELREIAHDPVAGAVMFSTTDGTRIRFVDRASGNIYQAKPDSFENVRLTDTLIPRVAEAVWARSGERVALRYLDERGETVRSFLAPVASTSAAVSKLSGAFLPDNITDLIFTSANVHYAVPSGSGISVISAGVDGAKAREVFSSPIRGWRVAPLGKGLLMTTRASAGLNGFAYAIAGSAQTKIKGPVQGLATLPNGEGTEVLISQSTRDEGLTELASLNVRKLGTTLLPVKTLVEKCAWASEKIVYCAVPEFLPEGEYPDGWYRGEIHFRDTLWKVDVSQGLAEFVASLSALAGRDIDAVNLSVSSDYLVFIHKTDGSLWGLRLESGSRN